jgi:hypothetical protein
MEVVGMWRGMWRRGGWSFDDSDDSDDSDDDERLAVRGLLLKVLKIDL